MADLLHQPVHLYVKTHRMTGLKYFGRTVEDPYSYLGSGAYWIRHIARYGNDVSTRVIGTFTDEAQLRAVAKSFSVEHDIATSTDWANLLPEDGDVAGDGWTAGHDHSAQIAALDAAVRRRLEKKRQEERQKRQEEGQKRQEEGQKKGDLTAMTFVVCLALISLASGIYWQSNSTPGDGYADGFEPIQFFLGAGVVLVSPLGWIPRGHRGVDCQQAL